MGAAKSPPLWGQNVGELLGVKRGESSGCIRKAVRLNGVRLNEDVEGLNIGKILRSSVLINRDVAPRVPEGQLTRLQSLGVGESYT